MDTTAVKVDRLFVAWDTTELHEHINVASYLFHEHNLTTCIHYYPNGDFSQSRRYFLTT